MEFGTYLPFPALPDGITEPHHSDSSPAAELNRFGVLETRRTSQRASALRVGVADQEGESTSRRGLIDSPMDFESKVSGTAAGRLDLRRHAASVLNGVLARLGFMRERDDSQRPISHILRCA